MNTWVLGFFKREIYTGFGPTITCCCWLVLVHSLSLDPTSFELVLCGPRSTRHELWLFCSLSNHISTAFFPIPLWFSNTTWFINTFPNIIILLYINVTHHFNFNRTLLFYEKNWVSNGFPKIAFFIHVYSFSKYIFQIFKLDPWFLLIVDEESSNKFNDFCDIKILLECNQEKTLKGMRIYVSIY